MAEGRYYWIKLKRDFFKRHDVRIIEGMPNGKDYLLFYLKLLCESVDHEGHLRFSEQIPYTTQMLSVITNTDEDIVKNALKAFTDLGMVSTTEDGTIYLNETVNMTGFETEWARKKREYRKTHKGQTEDNVLPLSDKSKSKSKSKSKNIKENIREKFTPPTLEEIEAYCKQRGNNVDAKAFFDFFDTGHWIDSKGNHVKNWKQKIITWEKFDRPFKQPPKKFNQIEQRDYDFDSLEKQLLSKPIGGAK